MEGSPKSCSEVQASLPLYVGGDLEGPELDAVGAHLAGCSDCATRCESARRARRPLERLRRDQVRAAQRAASSGSVLWPGIRERLLAEGLLSPAGSAAQDSELGAPVRAAGPRPSQRPWRSWGGVAAAAAAVVLMIPSIRQAFRSPVESPSPVAMDPGTKAVPVQLVSDGNGAVASETGDGWTSGIRPLQLVGSPQPEEQTLFDRALSGERPHQSDSSIQAAGLKFPRIR